MSRKQKFSKKKISFFKKKPKKKPNKNREKDYVSDIYEKNETILDKEFIDKPIDLENTEGKLQQKYSMKVIIGTGLVILMLLVSLLSAGYVILKSNTVDLSIMYNNPISLNTNSSSNDNNSFEVKKLDKIPTSYFANIKLWRNLDKESNIKLVNSDLERIKQEEELKKQEEELKNQQESNKGNGSTLPPITDDEKGFTVKNLRNNCDVLQTVAALIETNRDQFDNPYGSINQSEKIVIDGKLLEVYDINVALYQKHLSKEMKNLSDYKIIISGKYEGTIIYYPEIKQGILDEKGNKWFGVEMHEDKKEGNCPLGTHK